MKPKKGGEMQNNRDKRAMKAVSRIQHRSKDLGLDKLSIEEIEAEIKAVREDRASQSVKDEISEGCA